VVSIGRRVALVISLPTLYFTLPYTDQPAVSPDDESIAVLLPVTQRSRIVEPAADTDVEDIMDEAAQYGETCDESAGVNGDHVGSDDGGDVDSVAVQPTSPLSSSSPPPAFRAFWDVGTHLAFVDSSCESTDGEESADGEEADASDDAAEDSTGTSTDDSASISSVVDEVSDGTDVSEEPGLPPPLRPRFVRGATVASPDSESTEDVDVVSGSAGATCSDVLATDFESDSYFETDEDEYLGTDEDEYESDDGDESDGAVSLYPALIRGARARRLRRLA
jgi:hypothetical protein